MVYETASGGRRHTIQGFRRCYDSRFPPASRCPATLSHRHTHTRTHTHSYLDGGTLTMLSRLSQNYWFFPRAHLQMKIPTLHLSLSSPSWKIHPILTLRCVLSGFAELPNFFLSIAFTVKIAYYICIFCIISMCLETLSVIVCRETETVSRNVYHSFHWILNDQVMKYDQRKWVREI